MEITLSREKPVLGVGREPTPAHVRVEGDGEGGKCWIWLMFFLAPRKVRGSRVADEPWVEVSIDEAKQLRDRLDALIQKYDRPSLADVLGAARAARYPELHEQEDERPARELEEAVGAVLRALGDPGRDDLAWRRQGFVARALLEEAAPTVADHWAAGAAMADAVREALDAWLAGGEPRAREVMHHTLMAPQALGEAMLVVEDANLLMERAWACRDILAEMVDLVLQGYAVFPGSADRRALFDWWLNEVVPAAAELRAPRPFGRRVLPSAP